MKELTKKTWRNLLIGILDNFKDRVLSGECDSLPKSRLDMLIKLATTENEWKSTNEAIDIMGISRTKFFELKKAGYIHAPKKEPGKTPMYLESQLLEDRDNCIRMKVL